GDVHGRRRQRRHRARRPGAGGADQPRRFARIAHGLVRDRADARAPLPHHAAVTGPASIVGTTLVAKALRAQARSHGDDAWRARKASACWPVVTAAPPALTLDPGPGCRLASRIGERPCPA